MGLVLSNFTTAQIVLLFRKNNDGTSFRRFVRETRELRGISKRACAHSIHWNKLDRLPVAQSDCSCLVQQERIHISRGFNRLSAHGQNIVLHDPVHTRDANGREQARRLWSGSSRPAATREPQLWYGSASHRRNRITA